MTDSSIVIRLMKEQDIKSVCHLHISEFDHIGEDEGRFNYYLKDPSLVWIIAATKNDHNENVIGYCCIRKQNQAVLYGHWAAVKKDYRKLGIAKSFLKEIKTYANSNGFKSLLADTRNRFNNALIFYLKNEFKIIGTFLGNDNDLMIRVRIDF